MRPLLLLCLALFLLPSFSTAATGVHTSYLWHMHQPIYWPAESLWNPGRYETAYETLVSGHCQNDLATIFGSDDRIGDYQWYPRDAVASMLDLPDGGAQVSFAGALMENLWSLGDAGWNGGAYASDWYSHYREARSWTTSTGDPRLEPLLVGFHHAVAPLMDDVAFRMELAVARAIYDEAWGDTLYSRGFFPAETCFSERLIPALADAGIEWTVVADIHIARACADYPYAANQDNCDPPNRADQVNPAQGAYTSHFIPRGVTVKVPYPYGFTPHRAEYVDPDTGAVSTIVVAPAANAMSWDEGYGMFGTGCIDAIAGSNNPDQPMLVLFAHDGDNAWSGGHSYYYESVPQFSHSAAAAGYTPTTVASYLEQHPVPAGDIVHVEDGGWVNADGDFGSPQFINWNWPLVNAAGDFDIPAGWAEDERNWAVLTAAQNRVETAAQIAGGVDPEKVAAPLTGAGPAERAWHFLLAGYESGYMYYGAALDMEIKATLACNRAIAAADSLIATGADQTAPTVWLPQRLPWNPGGRGGGSLWGYPGGEGASMSRDFFVWTFASDVSGLERVELFLREDLDGVNDPDSHDNELYAGGTEVSGWIAHPMERRVMPLGEPWEIGEIDFPVLPTRIADEYWIEVEGYSEILLDYYVEAEDATGRIKRSPIQHVWIGDGEAGGEAAWWLPEQPEAGELLTVFYDPAGRPLEGAATVLIHRGHNSWQAVVDEPMAWDAVEETWSASFIVPGDASTVEFVFTDGEGTWDNNGGADWIVTVSGGEPGFQMDGQLDGNAPLLAAGQGLSLWGLRTEDELYLACEGTAVTEGLDHFLFVIPDPTLPAPAPWTKAGTVAAWDWMLGAEDSNDWQGWFDGAGQLQSGAAFASAQGVVLEGVLDLAALYPGGAPDTLWVAAAGYESPDGGLLIAQAPAGDGDEDLDPDEYLSLTTDATDLPTAAAARALAIHPNPFNPSVTLSLHWPERERVRVEVFDLSGRRLALLYEGPAGPGDLTCKWEGRDEAGRSCSSGLYLFRVESVSGRAVAKGFLLK